MRDRRQHPRRLAACIGLACALAAGAGGAAFPPDLQVAAPNPMVGILEDLPCSDATGGVRIVAARNGAFPGQVVLTASAPFAAAPATVSDLRAVAGDGRLSAACVQVRYARPDGFDRVRRARRFDSLADTPPTGTVRREVVWLTVNVPGEAAAGDYHGAVSIGERSVPLRVTICDWRLPSPREYASSVGIIQSPESVALQYQVPAWSDAHFRLIGKTFDLLGTVGNDVLVLPMVAKTHFGNNETVVRWIADGANWRYDFAPLEKYVELYLQKVGRPSAVCLYIWDRFADKQAYGGENTPGLPVTVSRLDPHTGKTDALVGPLLGTRESEDFWAPVLDGVRSRLHNRGIADEAILLGISGDVAPTKAVVASLARLAPYARWMVQGHPKVREVQGVKAGYVAYVWGTGGGIRGGGGDRPRVYGWKQELQLVVFPRFGCHLNPPLWPDAPLATCQVVTETALMCGLRGFGRVGADFWPVLRDARGNGHTIVNRFPECSLGQVTIENSTAALLAPGPDGALSTVRFELLRAGVEEAEARIFIEKALDDPARRARFGNELAQSCERVLDERLDVFVTTQPRGKAKSENDFYWYAEQSGWQDRTEALFKTAGLVAAELGTAATVGE